MKTVTCKTPEGKIWDYLTEEIGGSSSRGKSREGRLAAAVLRI